MSHYQNFTPPFEIPDSWEWVKLEDVCELIVDCPHSTAKDEGKGYALIRTPNIGEGRLKFEGVHRVSQDVYNQRNARAVPKKADLIYAREAPAGNAAVIQEGEIVCLGQRTVLIRPFIKWINSDYLAFALLAPSSFNRLVSKATGSTVQHVNLEEIRPFHLPLPNIREQTKIVDSIHRLFNSVEELSGNTKQLLQTMNTAKSKILELAMQGKLVPQNPNDEPAADMLRRVNPKARIITDNPHYPQLPDNWCSISILDCGNSALGKTLDREKNEGFTVPYICALNVQDGWFDLSTIKHFRLREHEKERYSVYKGDLMICEGGDVGRCAIWDQEPIFYQNALHRLRPHKGINTVLSESTKLIIIGESMVAVFSISSRYLLKIS